MTTHAQPILGLIPSSENKEQGMRNAYNRQEKRLVEVTVSKLRFKELYDQNKEP